MESATTVVRTLDALLAAEPEIAQGFLLAALYCLAIRQEQAPRDIAEALWKSLPGTVAWEGLRKALLASLEDGEPQ